MLSARRSGGMADAAGLNPAVPKGTWGFDSLLRHQRNAPALDISTRIQPEPSGTR